MKMDKTLIKDVRYSHRNQTLFVKFKDGGCYGEIGNCAVSTFKQLNDEAVAYIDLDSEKLKIN